MYSTRRLWIHYADVFNFLGGMPVNGEPRTDADCAIALSLARNTIPDHLLSDTRLMLDERFQGNHLAMMEHLCARGFDPGKPNNQIGNAAEVCISAYHLPVIGQWEIPTSICKRQGGRWTKDRLTRQQLFCLWPPYRPAYRTIEVLEDAFKITQEHGWKRPWLLAHDCHMPRVAMLAQYFWPEFIIGFPAICHAFDPKAVQSSATSPSRWYQYEFKARAHHFLHGWCFGRFTSGRF